MKKTTMRSAGILFALGIFCASAQAEIVQYDCGTKVLPSMILDYSADGKTVTVMNDVGKLVSKGHVLGRQSEQGINYLLLNAKIDPSIAPRLTGESRDQVTLKAGRHVMKCARMQAAR